MTTTTRRTVLSGLAATVIASTTSAAESAADNDLVVVPGVLALRFDYTNANGGEGHVDISFVLPADNRVIASYDCAPIFIHQPLIEDIAEDDRLIPHKWYIAGECIFQDVYGNYTLPYLGPFSSVEVAQFAVASLAREWYDSSHTQFINDIINEADNNA